MTAQIYLTRLTMKRDSDALRPLLGVLAPGRPGDAMAMTHRLMWSVMPSDVQAAHDRARRQPGDSRPFLWREMKPGHEFYLLGAQPVAESPIFTIETKPFVLALAPGDRLAFDLRVNATVDRKIGDGPTGRGHRQRIDVALDRLRADAREAAASAAATSSPPEDARPEDGDPDRGQTRRARRDAAAAEAAHDWLTRQAGQNGFSLEAMQLTSYRVEVLPRSGASARIGVFDLNGLVKITDAEAFARRVRAGFGRARAFGCGLMLLRRA